MYSPARLISGIRDIKPTIYPYIIECMSAYGGDVKSILLHRQHIHVMPVDLMMILAYELY